MSSRLSSQVFFNPQAFQVPGPIPSLTTCFAQKVASDQSCWKAYQPEWTENVPEMNTAQSAGLFKPQSDFVRQIKPKESALSDYEFCGKALDRLKLALLSQASFRRMGFSRMMRGEESENISITFDLEKGCAVQAGAVGGAVISLGLVAYWDSGEITLDDTTKAKLFSLDRAFLSGRAQALVRRLMLYFNLPMTGDGSAVAGLSEEGSLQRLSYNQEAIKKGIQTGHMTVGVSMGAQVVFQTTELFNLFVGLDDQGRIIGMSLSRIAQQSGRGTEYHAGLSEFEHAVQLVVTRNGDIVRKGFSSSLNEVQEQAIEDLWMASEQTRDHIKEELPYASSAINGSGWGPFVIELTNALNVGIDEPQLLVVTRTDVGLRVGNKTIGRGYLDGEGVLLGTIGVQPRYSHEKGLYFEWDVSSQLEDDEDLQKALAYLNQTFPQKQLYASLPLSFGLSKDAAIYKKMLKDLPRHAKEEGKTYFLIRTSDGRLDFMDESRRVYNEAAGRALNIVAKIETFVDWSPAGMSEGQEVPVEFGVTSYQLTPMTDYFPETERMALFLRWFSQNHLPRVSRSTPLDS